MKPSLLVLAAGLGSRYGGVKQIDPVGTHGEALLDYSVFDAKCSGYGKVVFIIRPDIEKDFRERLFDRIARNMDAEYVFQTHESLLTADQIKASEGRTKPWGTVHALLCAKDVIKTPFTVINADDFYGREAYGILGDYLSTLENDSTEHAMVGYLLKNTMSPMGSVSRGVCRPLVRPSARSLQASPRLKCFCRTAPERWCRRGLERSRCSQQMRNGSE